MKKIFSKTISNKFLKTYSNKKLTYDEKVIRQIQNEIPKIFEKYMNGEELSRKEEIEYQSTLNRAVYKSRQVEIEGYEERVSQNTDKNTKEIHKQTGKELPEGYEYVKY